MNFLNLYYFSIAAEELNFTKAAKRLFTSQQSLSTTFPGWNRNLALCYLTAPSQ